MPHLKSNLLFVFHIGLGSLFFGGDMTLITYAWFSLVTYFSEKLFIGVMASRQATNADEYATARGAMTLFP